MGHWQKIRELARAKREEVCDSSQLDSNQLLSCKSILEKTISQLGLTTIPEHPESAHLQGSYAVLEDDLIFFSSGLDEWFGHYCIAHEVGHHILHHKSIHCGSGDFENLETDEELPTATSLVIGYGPNERREREANLFALEFLLPAKSLRKAYIEGGLNAFEISKATGMPRSMVERQLARALLTQEPDPNSIQNERVTVVLNKSQQKAVDVEGQPTLVSAGPGTGKTETLIQRIVSLLDKGVAPEKILALTFSHKATEEMRERIANDRPNEASRMQIMTFHSFGLDILRKFWEEANLETDSNLLDPIDAILMLEENLAKLNLNHYMMLSNPVFYLPAILSAISRAKDELCTPKRYRELAEKMVADAKDEKETLVAAKALEVAGVYEFYQDLLNDKKLLDFGDLIFKAVELLETNESTRNFYQERFDAVLVDEFQDVNRASGVLLRLIAKDSDGLWAVGDLRQSIYRWRGASPQNIREFESEYDNAKRLSLETNYRSVPDIVNLFGKFAQQMIAGAEFSDWEVFRKESGDNIDVTVTVSDKYAAEVDEIANQIKKRKKDGIDYRDQAIICRAHAQLADLARDLGKKGIPVLYLGKLFERSEIRDLLALLELKTGSGPHGLIRVGNLQDYQIGEADLDTIVTELSKNNLDFPGVIKELQLQDKISAESYVGLRKLVSHLRLDENVVSASSFLNKHLFSDSMFLRDLIEDKTPSGKQKLIAVYQFLQLAKSLDQRFRSRGVEQISYFLKHVRRLAWFGEQTNLAQIPPAAENFDSVRLITVHGAKGLEFDTVYLPYLAAGKFPANRRGSGCPEPVGMIENLVEQHAEEEECLYFVAMSRAKSRLLLSRSEYYGVRKNKPSKFLTAIEEYLPVTKFVHATEPAPAEPIGEPPDQRNTFYMAEINRYDRCPKQFYYYHLKGLKKAQDTVSAYVKFHRCLYQLIGQLNSSKLSGNNEINSVEAQEILSKFWIEANLDEHPYAPVYKKIAREIADSIAQRINETPVQSVQPELELEVANGKIKVKPDAVEVIDETAVVTKYKTGKRPKNETVKIEDVAAKIAAETHFATTRSSVRRLYLADLEESPLKISEKVAKNRIKTIESHIDGINSRQFTPKPSDRNCPGCQYYFVCPGGE